MYLLGLIPIGIEKECSRDEEDLFGEESTLGKERISRYRLCSLLDGFVDLQASGSQTPTSISPPSPPLLLSQILEKEKEKVILQSVARCGAFH